MGFLKKFISFFPRSKIGFFITAIFTVVLAASWLFFIFDGWKIFSSDDGIVENSEQNEVADSKPYLKEPLPPPEQVKAIYITSPSVFDKKFDELSSLFNKTQLNSVVITMKSGGGIYKNDGVDDLVRKLKERDIYTIARLTVFQDNELARARPDLALKSGAGGLWRDGSGAYWVDPASREIWDYNIAVSKEVIDLGFDELNLDYIRFPSDGDLSVIRYPLWSGAKNKTGIINDFFAYFARELKNYEPKITLSADIFGYVLLTHVDDAGIGQRLGDAASYFDVVAPMLYPSHYSAGNFGFQNPAAYPYEIVLNTLEQGREKLGNMEEGSGIVRPWLQAFHMGAIYDSRMVSLEKRAVLDAGFDNGWMLWNPQNRYPKELFNPD